MATIIFWSRRVKYILVGLMLLIIIMLFCSNMARTHGNHMYGRVDISNYFMDFRQPPFFYSGAKKNDEVDNSAATVFLKKYKDLFGDKSAPDRDPNEPETIETWWEAAAMIDWYTNTSFRYSCLHIQHFGGWDLCQDIPYEVKGSCLVYSFGMSHAILFDKEMEKLGCEVHSFSPSLEKIDESQKGHNSTYHSIGLGSEDVDQFIPRKDTQASDQQTWKLRTLRSLIQALGHEKRTIDVLKIDMEGYEWDILDNMMDTDMLKNVRQLMLELHIFPDWPAKDRYIYMFRDYTRLRELGFREYKVSQHSKNLSVNSFNLSAVAEFVNAFFKIEA